MSAKLSCFTVFELTSNCAMLYVIEAEDEADAALVAPGDVHDLLEKLRYNMTVLVTLSNQQLQVTIPSCKTRNICLGFYMYLYRL